MNVIFGDSSSEDITGSSGDDKIYAAGGNDAVDALGGDDIVLGGSGDDLISGGAGSDIIGGGSGDDFLVGGVVGADGYDVLSGGDGDDTLVITGRPGAVHGGAGMDQLRWYADGNAPVVIGISSDADPHAFVGTDGTVVDGVEQLIVQGGSGNDWVRGGDSIDVLYVNGGSNTVDARGGDDIVSIRAEGANIISGGEGADMVDIGRYGSDTYVFAVVQGVATDSYGSHIVEVETFRLFGSEGVELASFGRGDDTFFGRGGNDVARGGGGADKLAGGDGDDTLFGNNGDDKLFGNDGNDIIFGGLGDDRMRGDAGDDVLNGGTGADHFNGGLGADRFFINGDDVIGGFHSGEDRIALKASDFGLDPGYLSSDRFALDAAVGGQGQFVYHTGNGHLAWDADGDGAGGEILLATLYAHPLLSYGDFDLY